MKAAAIAFRNEAQRSTPTAASYLSHIFTNDPQMLRKGIEFVRAAYDSEENRLATVETKATTLISALAITVTIVISVGGLLLSTGVVRFAYWETLVVVLGFLLANFFLVMALYSALGAIRVSQHAQPDPNDFLELQFGSIVELERSELASLLASYCRNVERNNQKAGYLRDAQRHFFWAAIALVAIGVVIVVHVILGIHIP